MAGANCPVRDFVRGFLSVLLCLCCATPVLAQQATRVPVEQAGRTIQLTAQLYRPASPQPAPAVAIFHGCGGVGVNNTRMAELLKDWGYVALVVDSFSARGLKDVCGRNWPTQAAAEERAHDIDAALAWLGKQSFVDARRLAFMGYSYGGGVAMLRALSPASDTAGADAGARGDPGLSGLCAGRCAGHQARRPPADAVRHGRARRLDAGVAMQGGDRSGSCRAAI